MTEQQIKEASLRFSRRDINHKTNFENAIRWTLEHLPSQDEDIQLFMEASKERREMVAYDFLKSIKIHQPEALKEFLADNGTHITKEGLEQLGFKTNSSVKYFLSLGKCLLWVTNNTWDVYIEGYMEGMTVPNCKSIEDLQALINLFK